MEFTLSIESANTLVRFAKSYIKPKLQYNRFTVIHCEVTKDKLTAKCISDFSFAEITMLVDDFKGEEGECFLIPPEKLFHKNDERVRVLIAEQTVTYNTAGSSQSFSIKQSDYKMMNTKGFWREPQMTIYFDPKLLIESLKPYVNNKECVRIDCLLPNEGFIISQSNTEEYKSLVLPVRRAKGVK